MKRFLASGLALWMVTLALSTASVVRAEDTSVVPPVQPPKDLSLAGNYRAILQHEGTNFYQYANILFRTVNTGGSTLKISANVRVYFGDMNSTEFLTYEFDDCPMNLLTRQISIKNEKRDISMIGFLKTGQFQGEWYSNLGGKVGKFVALKEGELTVPKEGVLVRTLTGHYRGSLVNTNSASNLPERATMSIVSTQDTSTGEPTIRITGSVRLYIGDFNSLEYVETKLKDIQFNFYNRVFSASTVEYGLTFKGKVSQDGVFTGTVFADGLGEVANADLKRL